MQLLGSRCLSQKGIIIFRLGEHSARREINIKQNKIPIFSIVQKLPCVHVYNHELQQQQQLQHSREQKHGMQHVNNHEQMQQQQHLQSPVLLHNHEQLLIFFILVKMHVFKLKKEQ